MTTWETLLRSSTDTLVLPWVGGPVVASYAARYSIKEKPVEHGWYRWKHGTGRTLLLDGPAEPDLEVLGKEQITGYLMGDFLVPDQVQAGPTLATLTKAGHRVHLIPEGLDRFSRIAAAPSWPSGPYVYLYQVFPLGPEPEVLDAYLDRKDAKGIKGITPALYAAFQLEVQEREAVERRRAEIERQRRLEEERLAKEAARQELLEKAGSSAKRRELAAYDFEAAASAALEAGGATYLDSRKGHGREMIVRYRLRNRRFECVCDARTLRISDAGICLQSHGDDDDFEAGERGDTLLTLESLPSVVCEAIDRHLLVVFRHV